MKKGQLNYSELSDTIYWVNEKGIKQDVTQNFIQMVLLWLNKTDIAMAENESIRELTVNGRVHWKILCKKISE